MRFVRSDHEPGTIVAAQDHLGRYPEFEICLERLRVPEGTTLLRPRSGCCAFNCNNGVANRKGGWVWFIDDDQTFEADVVMRLLEHRKDIVAPLVPMRYYPFELVMYSKLDIRGAEVESDFYRIAELADKRGLMQVAGLPKAGLLVRDRVWASMPRPWFKVGRIRPDEIDDDRYFMWEVRQHGFELWADLDQYVPHITTLAISLGRDADGRLERFGTVAGRRVGLTI